ncbi:reverse transcriptase/maturase [Streptomyces lydicamycinicus]|uniref:Reverse transcriptase/maturase n=1 Tax=Streptomyces lydicamycinicus TaxID=1546107 RepID=A0A0P4RH77_9ACTN|nr:reverse transcriptase/maturase [Streptomyces lydicamycinicus]
MAASTRDDLSQTQRLITGELDDRKSITSGSVGGRWKGPAHGHLASGPPNPKPGTAEQRPLPIPSVRDRIVQAALQTAGRGHWVDIASSGQEGAASDHREHHS